SFNGRHPVELIGGVRFPAIGELPYLLTLAGHSFYWFRLSEASAPDDRTAGGSAGLDRTP
ncbi:alpha-glucosidase C-terminal domain-containing protein, partial [Streptomyces sp. NPDC051684]|uniref:alpha-glucosidase C-terminal domain-containing protein n=1 Tax=Streptomyces sp. NPDC051684 TaxID=3365670 RepID=UPI0037A67622